MTLHTKYRPVTLDQLVGQDFIKRALGGALSQRKIAPSYLFVGSRGTGKTSTARILAKGLNCQLGVSANPCNRCNACQSIDRGSSLDVVEIDAASNSGVDDARELRSQIMLQPMGRYRVFIIDECHMLSTAAQNALLKTLEEPPAHVVFILATTDPQKLLDTIRSRCHEFRFKFAPQADVIELLSNIAEQEKININQDALKVIAQVTGGGLRDSQTLLATLATLSGEITPSDVYEALGTVSPHSVLPILQACESHNVKLGLEQTRGLINLGAEPKALLDTLIGLYRDLLTWVSTGSEEYLNTSSDVVSNITKINSSKDSIIQKLERLAKASSDFNLISQSQISVFLEVLVMELATMREVSQTVAQPQITPSIPEVKETPSPKVSNVTPTVTQDGFNPDEVLSKLSLFSKRVFAEAMLYEDGRIVFPNENACVLAARKADVIHQAYKDAGYNLTKIQYLVQS
jgi:DNA polymerase-3 subunit gamma/tau